MKNLLKLELKNFFAKKSNILIIIFSMVLISLFIASESRYIQYPVINEKGQIQRLRSKEAINLTHNVTSEIEGYLSDEKLEKYLVEYGEVKNEYDENNIESVRLAMKYTNIGGLIECAFKPNNQVYEPRLDTENITNEEAASYYSIREENQKLFFDTTYKGNSVIIYKMLELESKVEKPFYVTQFIGWDSVIRSFNLVFILMSLLCCFIISPVFTSSYSSGEDEVFKSTIKGSRLLGRTKIIASLIESLILFLLSMISYIGTAIYFYGFEGLKTSIQAAINPILPYPFSLGGLFLYIMIIGVFCIFYLTIFISYISSKTRSIVISSATSVSSLILCIFLIGFVNFERTVWEIMIRLLPTGGISIYTDVIDDIMYFSIGGFAIGVGTLFMISSIIIGMILFVLTERSYKKYQLHK